MHEQSRLRHGGAGHVDHVEPAQGDQIGPARVAGAAGGADAAAGRLGAGAARLRTTNATSDNVAVVVAFGSGSVVGPSTWSFCTKLTPETCDFPLAANSTQDMPLGGRYLNATLSFDRTATCGATKAEVNVNNPSWYDIADVSLVDGYSNKIEITAIEPGADAGSVQLGPPVGRSGNERVFGVFPLGCDICVERQHPPCGMTPGKSGCKSGSQYKPDVPCQYQGSVLGGGTTFTISLVK